MSYKIDLYIACPICVSSGRNTIRQYWTHHGACGGILCIDENAIIECRKCHKKAHIKDMRFICPDDLHHFGKASSAGLSEALSCSAQMVNASVMSWLISVIKHLD